MEQLAIISHNFFRANGFHKIRSPSSPYGPAPQGSQLITLNYSPYLIKSKNGFFIVFSNLAWKYSVCFLKAMKHFFLPNGLHVPPKQPWGSPKFSFIFLL